MVAYESFSDCINCMLCYAACPQFGENPDFIGPGAMALLQRYNGDSRDGGQKLRLDTIHGEDGVWSCTAVGVCSEVCPKHVDPANAVNQNKTNSAFDFFLRFLSWGSPMSERRPYRRPMDPKWWWAPGPYRAYTLRELTGVAVALYGAVLFFGLVSLAGGPDRLGRLPAAS